MRSFFKACNCGKPIRKLCWPWWIQLFRIHLLHSWTIFIRNWRRYFKVGQLYFKGKHNDNPRQFLSITKWDKSYYEVWKVLFYDAVQSLLQSGAGTTKWGKVITKWNRYYKMRQILQIGHYIHPRYIKESVRKDLLPSIILLICVKALKLWRDRFIFGL